MWRQPFIRIIVPLISGILVARIWTVQVLILFGLIFCGILSLLFLNRSVRISTMIQNSRLSSLAIILSIFFIGFSEGQQLREKSSDTAFVGEDEFYKVLIYNMKEKENSFQMEGRILWRTSEEQIKSGKQKVLLYLQKDSLAGQIHPGNLILFKTKPDSIPKPYHPTEFNFSNYWARKGIYIRSYLKAGSWKIIPSAHKTEFKPWLELVRMDFVQRFKQAGLEGKDLAFVSALVLGYKDLLNDELKNDFSRSGTIHILAVSGLHVGIVYLILSVVLSFLQKHRYGKLLHFLLILSSIWLYAFFTGFSPSVVRASVMFSFILLGKATNRQINIYNIIAASAFFILFFDPEIILELGFQLSYLAVISIVYFFPKLKGLFPVKNKILSCIVDLILVPISAQILIVPLSIYYFHQIPLLFIVSNFIIIPTIPVLIYSSIMLLIFPGINFLSSFLANSIHYINLLIFYVNHQISSWPSAVIDHLFIDVFEMILLFLFIISLSSYLIYKMRKAILLSLLFMIILIIYPELRFRNLTHNPDMQTFKYNNKINMAFFYHQKCFWIYAETQKPEVPDLFNSFPEYFLKRRLRMNDIQLIEQGTMYQSDYFYCVENYYLCKDKKIYRGKYLNHIPVNVLLWEGKNGIELQNDSLQPDTIIYLTRVSNNFLKNAELKEYPDASKYFISIPLDQ